MGNEAFGNSVADSGVSGGDDIGAGGIAPVIDTTTIEPAPVKRGRGRPPKSSVGSSAGNAAKSGVGKPARAKATQADVSLDVPTLSLIVSFVGGLIASRNSALALDNEEAGKIAEAAANVGQHYPLLASSPKQQAWIALGMTVGSIYAGKIMFARLSRASPAPKGNGATDHSGFSPAAGGIGVKSHMQ